MVRVWEKTWFTVKSWDLVYETLAWFMKHLESILEITWLIVDNTATWSVDGSWRLVQEGEDHLSLMICTPRLLMFLYMDRTIMVIVLIISYTSCMYILST